MPVPDLDAGLAFSRDLLGHRVIWRRDDTGQAGLALAADTDTELVLTTRGTHGPAWLVASVEEATVAITTAGRRTVERPHDIPVGRLAVMTDVFGSDLVLLDLSKGRYITDGDGNVTGVG